MIGWILTVPCLAMSVGQGVAHVDSAHLVSIHGHPQKKSILDPGQTVAIHLSESNSADNCNIA